MNEDTYRVLVHKRQKEGLVEIPVAAVTAILVDYGDKVLAEVTAGQHQQMITAGYRVEDLREQNKIRVGTTVVDPATPAARSLRSAGGLPGAPLAADAEEGGEPQYYLIQFIGPVKPEWLEQLQVAGVNPLTYYHDFSYLVQGNAAAVAQAALSPVVQTYMPYVAEFTLQPTTRAALTEEDAADGREVWLLLFTASDIPQTIQQIETLGGEILEEETPSGFYQRLRARVPLAALDDLATMPAIYQIEPYTPRRSEDEVANQIVAGNLSDLRRPLLGYAQWLQRVGVDGAGVTIGINDEGIDETHPAFAGRLRKLTVARSPHGTMVAGQAAGNYIMAQAPDTDGQLLDGLGFVYGVGVAPGADLIDTQSAAECVTQSGVRSNDVGRIINNSWGMGTSATMDYRSDERAWDSHVRNANPSGATPAPLVVCFSAGNSGSQGLTRPKASKNSIVTGNFENFRPDLFGTDADDIDNRVSQSSIGNCADGRIKPDVVAPGERTASAAFPQPGDICHFLRFGNGTSAASPKTAGACALIIQWWRQRHSRNGAPQTPSPAMIKALLINGAADTGAGGPIPNREQGWGRVHLNNIFNPTTPAIYLDQEILLRPADPAVAFELETVDPTRPLKITLVWSDALGNPGSGTAGNPALVNALGLRMTQDNFTWFGNNFAGGWSQTGGVQDAVQSINPGRIVNNVQNIFIQRPNGRYAVHITPEIIAGDCMNVAADVASSDFRQDFALAIQNARLAPGSTLALTLAVDPTEPEEEATGAASNLVFLPLIMARRMEDSQRSAHFRTTHRAVNGAQPTAEAGMARASRLTALTRAAHSPVDTFVAPLSRRVIVFVSGEENGQLPTAQEIERLGKEHRIHTIGLGSTVDGRRLQAIAQSTHGAFWHAFDPSRRAALFHAILAEESDAEVINHITGILSDQAQITTFPIVASDRTALFLMQWNDPTVLLNSELIAPDGEVITPARAQRSTRMHHTSHATGVLYRVERPRRPGLTWEGDWSVKLSCDTALAAPLGFTISALVHSSLRLTLQWDKRDYRAGESLRLNAQVTDNEQVLTRGLSLQVRTQAAAHEGSIDGDQPALFTETETTATTTFALLDDAQPRPEGIRFDTPHSAEVKTYLHAAHDGIHTHWIQVQGHTANNAPFARTRVVSRYILPASEAVTDLQIGQETLDRAQMRSLGEVAGAEAVSASASAPLVVGKVEELCYGGDGLFQGFTLRTAEGSRHIPTCAQPLAAVIANALQQGLRVAVRRQAGNEAIAEVRLLSPM